MQLNDPFPLNSFPSQVKNAILDEFKGRCPTIIEVAHIPDAYWLATPAIGPAILERIRSFTHVGRLTDAELLDRLDFVRDELRCIEDALKAKVARASPSPPSAGRDGSRDCRTVSSAVEGSHPALKDRPAAHQR
jgi:hypothetical protein